MIRDYGNAQLRTEAGKPMSAAEHGMVTGEVFEAYIDWRADHPSDDIMTELLNVEFTDETGTVRRLRREELLVYLQRRGWRRQRDHHPIDRLGGEGARRTSRTAPRTGRAPRADSPSSRGAAALRAASAARRPVCHARRRVPRTDRARGQRDDDAGRRRRARPSPVPTGRRRVRHPSGATPASHVQRRHSLLPWIGICRLEGRIALEEILKRFPAWDVDMANASLSPTSTVRGWDSMPAILPN